MIKLYFNTTLKNLWRQKQTSLFNLIGLTVGIACCIFIMLYINDDCGYDKFNHHANRIYRLIPEIKKQGMVKYPTGLPAPLKDVLKEHIPDIENVVRVAGFQSYTTFLYKNKEFLSPQLLFADNEILEMFDFKYIKGTPQSLSDKNSIVITKSFAQKVFGSEDPIGKSISIKEGAEYNFLVSGVIDNLPRKSSIQFDGLCSFQLIKENRWEIWNYTTYVSLSQKANLKDVRSKFTKVAEKYLNGGEERINLHLQPLANIHLDLNLFNNYPTVIDNKPLYILGLIGMLIMAIACFNYIILSTSNTSKRSIETGIRKTIGASRRQLIIQYLGESILLTVIASFLSVLIVEKYAPLIGQFLGKQLFLHYNSAFFILFGLGSIFLGCIAGLYPSVILSGFKPMRALKNDLSLSKKNVFSGWLIIAQLTISITLIISTISIKKQLGFIKNRDIGLDYRNVLIVSIKQKEIKEKYKSFSEDILKNPRIISVSATSYIPGEYGFCQNAWWEGLPIHDNSNMMDWISVDTAFIKTLNVKMLEGKDFSKEALGINPYILNETALKTIGWDNPLGKKINICGPGEVIGIVKDFNFKSLHVPVRPLAICIYPDTYDYLYIRVYPDNSSLSVQTIKKAWNQWFPNTGFNFSFLNEYIEKEYNTEAETAKVINYFAFLAIILSCLGVFSLVSFETQRRTKEIGIRKVNGATVSEILALLNKDFIKWVTVAFLIACPIAWYAMHQWLQNFAYKTELSWWVFALAGIMAVAVALLTVSWQSWKAATRNPVESLRYE